MQARTSFNGGEQSKAAGARFDMDAFSRGCECVENWELSALGGVKRRRGMRQFYELEAGDEAGGAKLVPFVYSFSESEDRRYLVVVRENLVVVLDMAGEELARFEPNDVVDFSIDLGSVNYLQLNAVLLLLSAGSAPLELSFDDEGVWSLKRFEFSNFAWRYEGERRDYPIMVTARQDDVSESSDITYDVDFSEVGDALEAEVDGADELRISFWVDTQEAFALGANLRTGVEIRTNEVPASTQKFARFCVPSEMSVTYWACKQEFPQSVYVEGLNSPGNYPDNFEKAIDTSSYGSVSVYWSVRDVSSGTIDKGHKFGIREGYWKYYTCIKEFDATRDAVEGANSYDDYPEFFLPGIVVGKPLPCRRTWSFWNSGTWYGEYAVLRNFESSLITDPNWETAGRSKSFIASAANDAITGDESTEPCYLQLMLLKSRRSKEGSIVDGFPPDMCGNRLIVDGYQHHQVLKCSVVTDSQGEIVGRNWVCDDKVQLGWIGKKKVDKWSWNAFSDRYGYPRLAEIYGQRLVFAGTPAQPQTIWMSQPDDLGNFFVYEGDDSSIAVTLATTTQNPICWLAEMNANLVVGTSSSEFVIKGRDGAITPSTLVKSSHGSTGSAGIRALPTESVVLFIERGAGRCYSYGYNFEIDAYCGTDLTMLSPDVLAGHGGVVDSTLVVKPERQAVYALADGEVALCAFQNRQSVQAWHRWVTNGRVLSCCAVPNGNHDDRLFFVVARDCPVMTEDGTVLRQFLNVEVVDEESPYEDNYFQDYVSKLVTNSLRNPMDMAVDKGLRQEIAFDFLSDVPLKDMLFSSDGGVSWAKAPRQADWLAPGWHKLAAWNYWAYDCKVGVQVWGDHGCELLALQG